MTTILCVFHRPAFYSSGHIAIAPGITQFLFGVGHKNSKKSIFRRIVERVIEKSLSISQTTKSHWLDFVSLGWLLRKTCLPTGTWGMKLLRSWALLSSYRSKMPPQGKNEWRAIICSSPTGQRQSHGPVTLQRLRMVVRIANENRTNERKGSLTWKDVKSERMKVLVPTAVLWFFPFVAPSGSQYFCMDSLVDLTNYIYC